MTWLWKYLIHFYILWRTCTNNREIWIFSKKFGKVGWNMHNVNEEKRNNLCFFSYVSPAIPGLIVSNVICGLSFSLVLVPWVPSGFIRILWFSSPSRVQNQCFQISTQLGTRENKEPLCGCTTVKIIIIVIILIHTWPKERALLDTEM